MQVHSTKHVAPPPTRMSLANVTRGKLVRPFRVLCYGVEGVGKSTFASNAPAPVYLCAEDGTAHLDIARFPTPRGWSEVLEAVRVLTHEEHAFKTLVIDTLDWVEPLVWEHVCHVAGKNSIEDFGYGKGYTAALDEWRKLIARLELLVSTRKMHVVLLAHAQVRKHDDPASGAYDRYRLKLHDKGADILREWVDAILFARHEVMAVERKGKTRGVSSGARVVHTTWTAAYDAKNRFDLPDTLPLAWDEFEAAARAHVPADPAALRMELLELIPKLVDQDKARKAMEEWAGDSPARLAQLLDKVRSKVALEQGAQAQAQAAAAQGEG